MKGYNNGILVSNTAMKIGSNRDISRNHKKLTPPNVPKKIMIPVTRHDPADTTILRNLKILAEKAR